MAKKNHHPVSAEVENNPLYHDTYKLLRCYRDSTYSLMVAVRCKLRSNGMPVPLLRNGYSIFNGTKYR